MFASEIVLRRQTVEEFPPDLRNCCHRRKPETDGRDGCQRRMTKTDVGTGNTGIHHLEHLMQFTRSPKNTLVLKTNSLEYVKPHYIY